MEMAGSSNVLAVSTRTEDLRYMLASAVNVSDFVSVKLSSVNNNYDVWKSQILCLIESHDLLHIIHAKARFPWDKGDPMTQAYDKLVRGWILSALTNKVHRKFHVYRSVQLLWRNLELRYSGDGFTDETGDLIYIQASNIHVSNFVSMKLSGPDNYHIWRDQMLRLIESQDMFHVIHSSIRSSASECENLVKGWIFSTMDDELLKDFTDCSLASDLWQKLEFIFRDGDSVPDLSDLYVPEKDLKYTQALNVNVSNFVSVKLSGRNNFKIWKVQMLGLIQSQRLLRITKDGDGGGDSISEDYHNLVKGWIFSTMNDQMLEDFYYLYPATIQHIWRELESTFEKPSATMESDTKEDTVGFKFISESTGDIPEIENVDSIRREELYKAAIEGCWWKAKSILKIHRNAATDAITPNGNTILLVAVEMGHNYFLENLLEFIKDGKDMEVVNCKGRTALHIAAMVGNAHATQLLVQKRKQLLYIEDLNGNLPLDIATITMNLNISTYLFKFTTSSESVDPELHQIFSALYDAVTIKQYDLAETLLKKIPTLDIYSGKQILMLLTLTFPTDLGFKESLIYPSFHNVHRKTFERCSLLFHPIFLEKCVEDILQLVERCDNTCCGRLGKKSMIILVPLATLYPIYLLIFLIIMVLRLTFSMLYFLLWKVLTVFVRPIKNIENKKKEYQEAKKFLKLICTQMGSLHKGYSAPLFQAIRQGTYEVVDEILFTSPASINCKDKEGYNVIESAIIYRSEKVYNLIYHIIKRTESYRKMTDSSYNNLAHLAGRLAPSFVLDRITGAALQLQQELLWHEEVKKLYRPIELREVNIHEETPDMVFTKEHQDLMKQGESWMKTTAESCSITAALIITIVFAAAITVPGGSNQESGIPVFKKEIAFTIFALFDALSLFTATTALLLFLSILTTRFSYRDFLVSLPRRLIFGLLMLFLSTFGMIIAFGAILFLVFCDQRPWILAPIAGCACLPILVIVAIKIPLVVDLFQSTYFPIFGKRSYLESCKVNRKSTIFME